MKPLTAQDQARLGVGRCVRLAVSGMSYRLLRSGITTAILALAVAFLVHVLTHAILAERVQQSAWNELAPSRQATTMLTRLTTPDSATTVREGLADGNADRLAEYRNWFDGKDEDFAKAQQTARDWQAVERWAEGLTPSQSAVLLGGLSLAERLNRFDKQGDEYGRFGDQLEDLNLLWPMGDLKAFNDFMSSRRFALQPVIASIQESQRQASSTFAGSDNRSLLQRFADPAPELPGQLIEAGYVVAPDRLALTIAFAAYQAELASLRRQLVTPAAQQAAQRVVGTTEFDAVMGALTQSQPTWWYDATGQGGISFDAEGGVVPIARRYLAEQRLAAVTQDYEPIDRNTPFGLPVGTLWLVGLSLLVCVVGVTNALLMSVTERFNEIATMKCLGAMDRSIMQMFVAEAMIQGVLGGAVGVVLGLLLTLARGFAEFGTMIGRGFEGWSQLLAAAGLSLGIGVALAALAAVGPSWVASRLAPMEAMHVE